MDIKPIETVYKGYRFRSRLEARWAVYFDKLGIEYEYEKEGFDLKEDGYYLPDFYFPQMEWWGEVKGKLFTQEEDKKAQGLAIGTNNPVVKLEGAPDIQVYDTFVPVDVPEEYRTNHRGAKRIVINMECYIHLNKHNVFAWGYPIEDAPSDIFNGVDASRSARFEHGETPNKINRAGR